ncbi:hypothetical protein PG985_013243 [Apiospora marii]|uniref:uncharacterized protein n=1 Tax=Apiospora marii TaxID=335849 RepID=UPI00312FC812
MYVLDYLRLGKNTTLEDYPIAIAMGPAESSPGVLAIMQLGLGANSSLLDTLKNRGLIASRSWGFWWGRGVGMSPQIDGSLVLGGYDAARVLGDPLVADISPSPGCISGLSLPVADILVNYTGGDSMSLLGNEAGQPPSSFCLDPYRPTMMRLPVDPSIFRRKSMGLWTHNYDPPYSHSVTIEKTNATARFNGTLTITFESGLSIDFAADELVVPNVSLDKDTGEIAVHPEEPDIVLIEAPVENANEADPYPLRFGTQFLAAAYLLVNHDANKFYIWQVRSAVEELEIRARAVDASNNDVPDVCGTSEIGGATPTAGAPGDGGLPPDPGGRTEPSGSNENKENRTSVKTLVGIASVGPEDVGGGKEAGLIPSVVQ